MEQVGEKFVKLLDLRTKVENFANGLRPDGSKSDISEETKKKIFAIGADGEAFIHGRPGAMKNVRYWLI